MESEIIAQAAREARHNWLEQWLSDNPFYNAEDPYMVTSYHEATGAAYVVKSQFRYYCEQMIADLEDLHSNGYVSKNRTAIFIDGLDFSVSSYMLKPERFHLYV